MFQFKNLEKKNFNFLISPYIKIMFSISLKVTSNH